MQAARRLRPRDAGGRASACSWRLRGPECRSRAARAWPGCWTRQALGASVLIRQVGEKAGAVRQRPDAEVLGDRLPQIREGGARAEVPAGRNAGAGDEERHVLARVVRARRRRIVAVIGRYDEKI